MLASACRPRSAVWRRVCVYARVLVREGGRESAWATGSDAGEVLRGYRDARCIGGGA